VIEYAGSPVPDHEQPMAPIDHRVIGVTPISRVVNNSRELTLAGRVIGGE
jgi:hypothetical protein